MPGFEKKSVIAKDKYVLRKRKSAKAAGAKKDKYMYVVLVKAHTLLGKMSRAISLSGYEYTHIAVCFEEPFEDFVTFSRHKHYTPFDCGFMHETRDCYCYGGHNYVKIKAFKIPVSKDGMGSVKAYIEKIEKSGNEPKEKYIFNIYSMLTMGILHGLPIYRSHNCMSFTAKLLELSGAVPMDKDYYSYSIKDMDELLAPYFYKEGYMKRRKTEVPDYMDKVSLFKQSKLFFELNGELMYRLSRLIYED